MSLTTPSVKNAQFVAVVTAAILTPLSDTVPVVVPFNFDNVANLKVVTGSYTPANDEHIIIAGLTSISPNFFIFLCDGLSVFADDATEYYEVPITKFLFATMPPLVGGSIPIDGFKLIGSLSVPHPMPQGVSVNYTLILGQAVVT